MTTLSLTGFRVIGRYIQHGTHADELLFAVDNHVLSNGL